MIDLIKQTNVIPRSPTTELRLYCGVPWDDKYEHVRLFNNTQDLLNNLDNWRVYPSNAERLTEMSPIKVGYLTLRVPFTEMEALELNYLAFCNHGISETWVFCFINSIEWLSENSTRINFSLDIFQNNFYKCNIKPCFIEYHHIPRSEDEIGANLIPVNIETGEPIISKEVFYKFNDWYVTLYLTDGKTVYNRPGSFINHVYSGAQMLWLGGESEDNIALAVNEIIKQYVEDGQVDAIVNIVQTPHICMPTQASEIRLINIDSNFFEGYKPKNNKLYTYPWCYVMVDNMEGNADIFKFELSDRADHAVRFVVDGVLATAPQIITYPTYYKGIKEDYSDSLINVGFPICSWNSDTFRAWVAQNRSSLALRGTLAIKDIRAGALKSVAGAAAAPFTGGASLMLSAGGVSQASSGINNTLTLLGEVADKSRLPNTLHSKAVTNDLFVGIEEMGIRFYAISCKREFAEIADSFFEMYGYPIKKIEIPNLHSRSTWNYVKTSDCNFTGCIDLNQLKELRAIFDRGVTLWHTNDIGNYSLENN